MRRFLLVISVLGVVLAMPATASAHKLPKGFAVEQARELAQNIAFNNYFFTPDDFVSSSIDYTGRQFCDRKSKHKVNCEIGWTYEDFDSGRVAICTGLARSKLRRNSRTVATKLIGEVLCEESSARLETRMNE